MAALKNESYWWEVEDLPPFRQTENQHNYDEVWASLEKFQAEAGPKLNAISLIALGKLLRGVYEAGCSRGRTRDEVSS